MRPCCALGGSDGVTVKLPGPVAVLQAVTLTAPVAAPGMTMATSWAPVLVMGMAATPPIMMAVGLSRFVPVMVTRVPTGPEDGVKELMVTAGITVMVPVAVLLQPPPVSVTV